MAFTWNGKTIYESWERIDNARIRTTCNKIKDIAKDLKTASDNIKKVADDLNNDKVLYVNNRTYTENLYQYSEELAQKYGRINSIATAIINIADRKKEQEKSDYASYQQYLEDQKRAREKEGRLLGIDE